MSYISEKPYKDIDEVLALDTKANKFYHYKFICKICGKEKEKSCFHNSKENALICKYCVRALSWKEKYGVENISQLKEVKEKANETRKETCLEKYGKESYLATDECKQKRKDSLNKKYGVNSTLSLKSTQEKIKSTNKEKYGVEYNFLRKDVKEKAVASRIENNRQNKLEYHLNYIKNNIGFKNFAIEGENIKCLTCGRAKSILETSPQFLLCCPCGKLTSAPEKEIVNFVKSFGFEVIENSRKIISPKELDMYIPELKLAIEFDGAFWHSFKDKNYHNQKTEECEKRGIKLLHIFETDWLANKDIIMSIIRFNIRKDTFDKIYARNCEIIKLTKAEEQEFFNKNHIQGYCPSKLCLGLKHKNSIVQAMSFSKSRFNKNYEWEILREASELNTMIVGGKNRLFKNFIREVNPVSIISYCDRKYFSGKSYLNIGMKLEKTTLPSYFYFKSGKVYSRFQCQKHKLSKLLENFDSKLSESENMINNGFRKIYDCGNNVFTWRAR